MLRSLFCLLLAVPFVRAQAPGEPVHLILDTDIGNDVDDALALAMIHAFESRGEARLLAVTITKDNRYAPAFVDFVMPSTAGRIFPSVWSTTARPPKIRRC